MMIYSDLVHLEGRKYLVLAACRKAGEKGPTKIGNIDPVLETSYY
jgi:hypothetical protein